MVKAIIKGCLLKEGDIDVFLKRMKLNILGVKEEDDFPIIIDYEIKGDHSGKGLRKKGD